MSEILYRLLESGKIDKDFLTLHLLCQKLYYILYENKPKLENINIQIIYHKIPVVTYKIKFTENLILFNSRNRIYICDLLPDFLYIDKFLSEIYEKPVKKKIPNKHIPQISKKNCKKTLTNITEEIKTIDKSETIFDEEFEKKKDDERIKKINENRILEKINIFKNDKNIYLLIKKDIENGNITMDTMNTDYILKYEIFSILEFRGQINFNTNDNIDKEYTIFSELMELCHDDDLIEDNSVYIPHNYQYYSDEQKKKYAESLNLTIKDIEKV